MNRTFRLKPKINLDARLTANNVLNHVTFSSWYTNINEHAVRLARGGECDAQRADYVAAEVLTYATSSIVSTILGMMLVGTLRRGRAGGGAECAAGREWHVHACLSSSKLVIEAVKVKDKQGKSITGLTTKDFTVTEDGVPQKISFCEYQELPEAPHGAACDDRRGRTSRSTTGWRVTQIAAEKPGEVKYKDKPADGAVLRPDGDAAGRPDARAGGGAEVYPDADDLGGPGVDHAL